MGAFNTSPQPLAIGIFTRHPPFDLPFGFRMSAITLEHRDDYWHASFFALGSPCELLVDSHDRTLSAQLAEVAFNEAKRVEQKFSRYRDDNIVHIIHHHPGVPVEVDDETTKLLDYADLCYDLSEGLFDITSGVLRKVWKFDGSDHVPRPHDITPLLPQIGWNKVTWRPPYLTLPAGMEIDFGGIGKEYAVDKTGLLLTAQSDISMVVNFGGDLFVTGRRATGSPWRIGIDNPEASGLHALAQLELTRGGVATSGDARRFLLKDNIRYGHILNPKTGWPVRNTPRSVTVAAPTCLEAGILTTFAMLNGKNAEKFLCEQQVQHWIVW